MQKYRMHIRKHPLYPAAKTLPSSDQAVLLDKETQSLISLMRSDSPQSPLVVGRGLFSNNNGHSSEDEEKSDGPSSWKSESNKKRQALDLELWRPVIILCIVMNDKMLPIKKLKVLLGSFVDVKHERGNIEREREKRSNSSGLCFSFFCLLHKKVKTDKSKILFYWCLNVKVLLLFYRLGKTYVLFTFYLQQQRVGVNYNTLSV